MVIDKTLNVSISHNSGMVFVSTKSLIIFYIELKFIFRVSKNEYDNHNNLKVNARKSISIILYIFYHGNIYTKFVSC